MRAKHKYNPRSKEGARRIAQSYGYRVSIYDMPQMINLMARAGIYLADVDYTKNPEYLPFESDPDLVADSTKTITL